MNVSRNAEQEFLTENIRRDTPDAGLESGSQALTNFMLGLPIGEFRFEVIAGEPAPTPAPMRTTRNTATLCGRT